MVQYRSRGLVSNLAQSTEIGGYPTVAMPCLHVAVDKTLQVGTLPTKATGTTLGLRGLRMAIWKGTTSAAYRTLRQGAAAAA
jgi:hypothetical protein